MKEEKTARLSDFYGEGKEFTALSAVNIDDIVWAAKNEGVTKLIIKPTELYSIWQFLSANVSMDDTELRRLYLIEGLCPKIIGVEIEVEYPLYAQEPRTSGTGVTVGDTYKMPTTAKLTRMMNYLNKKHRGWAVLMVGGILAKIDENRQSFARTPSEAIEGLYKQVYYMHKRQKPRKPRY